MEVVYIAACGNAKRCDAFRHNRRLLNGSIDKMGSDTIPHLICDQFRSAMQQQSRTNSTAKIQGESCATSK